jgi:biopolymer transport protein ExbB
VVIGILAVMAAISWYVMAVKGLIIARIRKDNKAFVEAYYESKDMEALYHEKTAEEIEEEVNPLLGAVSGDHSGYKSSTIYHLYRAGMKDVRGRFAGQSVGAARANVLTAEALTSIRAALDAANVRETQRLNNQMVLLTLAVSGGPFLGLLGTVVGVMITFAAIAASGDVNVNAIAPGIAAALVATVAGLVVAIPALFGYNYLGNRIKEITADNRVFLDEFLATLAETYSK